MRTFLGRQCCAACWVMGKLAFITLSDCRSQVLSFISCRPMQYTELDADVSAAGRVMLRRVMGKLAFITLRDDSGDVQLYLDRSVMNEEEAESFRWAWS